MKRRLIIVDVSNFIFRAFFAIRPLNAPDGTPVNAVHGVFSMLLKLLSDYRPTHILLARDTAGGTFRNQLYDQYKANRSEPPPELVPQFKLIDQLIEKMQIPAIADNDFEADDIIGSACIQFCDSFDEILIASGDKDLMQFVTEKVKMVDTMKDKVYGPADVFEKMGVRPDQIVDYLSIVGDTSDNIPGMKGVGAKGAAKLLEEYGTLEKCIEMKGEFTGKKLINAFENHLDDALLSKKLVQIVVDMKLPLTAEDIAFKFYPSDELIEYLQSLGFKTVIKKLQDMRYQVQKTDDLDQEHASAFGFEKPSAPQSSISIEAVETDEQFLALKSRILSASAVALYTVYDSSDMILKKLTRAAFSFDGQTSFTVELEKADWLKELLKATWGNENIEICSEHIKNDHAYALVNGISFVAPTFDITQVHYNLSSAGRHDLSFMSEEILGLPLTAEGEIGEKAAFIYLLSEEFKKRLKELDLEKIYYEIDDPLISILAEMEVEGISLDPEVLNKLETELSETLKNIEESIEKIVETKINLNSPKQVGELLFEKLQLPIIKKTKTGLSTDVEVLEELQAMNISEVPGLILQHRELGKILSTYVKALPQLIHPKTGRIHTSFQQHVAQTGRLSSINPNLQNIPVRSEIGRKVRQAFVSKPGFKLLAADYSQVELRLLAHFSEDPTMLEAFNTNRDIHTQTASEVLSIPLDKVTSNDRSKAKAVNFGLMYGQSSFGLSKVLKISRKEAMDYITMYFARFSKVKSFLDSLKELCEQRGYAMTLHGRKRLLPDIHSTNRNIKSQAERMAVNSPIQGTAADIIKIAMINIHRELRARKLKSRMLLQVHDELIFEVPDSEIEEMKTLVADQMEHVVNLSVPLKVDLGVGVNWYNLKD